MPELPDVEHFRRYVEATALQRKVASVEVRDRTVLANASAPALRRAAEGRRFTGTHRHGKHLFLAFDDDGGWLAMHFGMTGKPDCYRDEGEEPDHARVVFDLANGYHLAFDCQRLLGRVAVVRDRDAFLRAHRVGPDALRIGREAFVDLITASRGGLKSTLMDQARMAGVGNVYADEILFHARRPPKRKARSLDAADAEHLHGILRRVLETSIERKAERANLPNTWIAPRRRDDAPACPRGCGTLRKEKVNGRTTIWCPRCQR
jgi:formamidopyrimidine-DNA glycosylase